MTTLSILGQELEQALEELQTVQAVSFNPGLESFSASKYSLTYHSAALEAQDDAKKNWFTKLVAFFKRLFERIQAWFKKRKAAGQQQDIEKRVSAYKDAVSTYRENDKVNDKELDAVLNAADDKSVFEALKKQADAAVQALLKDQEFFKKAGGVPASVNLYHSFYQDKDKAKELLALMVTAVQHLDKALTFFQKALEEVRRGRDQGHISIDSLLESLQKCSDVIDQVDAQITALQEDGKAPQHCEDVFNAMLNVSFFSQLASTPLLKESKKLSDELMKASEGTLTWFENISQGTWNSGNELNDKIYAIGAQSIHNFAMSPAKFMMLISKLEALELRCVPGDPTALLRNLEQRMVQEAVGKVSGKTPQENTFIKEYIAQTVHNKVTTYIKMSGS